jgi:hypothetical protein
VLLRGQTLGPLSALLVAVDGGLRAAQLDDDRNGS